MTKLSEMSGGGCVRVNREAFGITDETIFPLVVASQYPVGPNKYGLELDFFESEESPSIVRNIGEDILILADPKNQKGFVQSRKLPIKETPQLWMVGTSKSYFDKMEGCKVLLDDLATLAGKNDDLDDIYHLYQIQPTGQLMYQVTAFMVPEYNIEKLRKLIGGCEAVNLQSIAYFKLILHKIEWHYHNLKRLSEACDTPTEQKKTFSEFKKGISTVKESYNNMGVASQARFNRVMNALLEKEPYKWNDDAESFSAQHNIHNVVDRDYLDEDVFNDILEFMENAAQNALDAAPPERILPKQAVTAWVYRVGLFWKEFFETPFTVRYEDGVYKSKTLDVLEEIAKDLDPGITRETLANSIDAAKRYLNCEEVDLPYFLQVHETSEFFS